MSQNDLVNFAKENFDITIGRSTIADLLKDSSKWLNITDTDGNETRRRCPMFQRMEQALMLWFSSARANKLPINDGQIKKKILKIKQ